mmetsp:Transcript_8232/g.19138  ORF Transcript_8232/g.19138 Transcript_8232/m.19138 type:complete len:266 (+) Transcript_8232:839-1636(+)
MRAVLLLHDSDPPRVLLEQTTVLASSDARARSLLRGVFHIGAVPAVFRGLLRQAGAIPGQAHSHRTQLREGDVPVRPVHVLPDLLVGVSGDPFVGGVPLGGYGGRDGRQRRPAARVRQGANPDDPPSPALENHPASPAYEGLCCDRQFAPGTKSDVPDRPVDPKGDVPPGGGDIYRAPLLLHLLAAQGDIRGGHARVPRLSKRRSRRRDQPVHPRRLLHQYDFHDCGIRRRVWAEHSGEVFHHPCRMDRGDLLRDGGQRNTGHGT